MSYLYIHGCRDHMRVYRCRTYTYISYLNIVPIHTYLQGTAEAQASGAGQVDNIHIHTYIHTCMQELQNQKQAEQVKLATHACMHTNIHTHIHTYLQDTAEAQASGAGQVDHTYIHTYVHTYIHICRTLQKHKQAEQVKLTKWQIMEDSNRLAVCMYVCTYVCM